VLTNTSAIPLAYAWRLVDGAPGGSGGGAGGQGAASKEFAVMPARGTVLPNGTQRVQVEFMPQVTGRGFRGTARARRMQKGSKWRKSQGAQRSWGLVQRARSTCT
jgi:hypothetical protein